MNSSPPVRATVWQPVFRQSPVGQARQRVVESEPGDLLLARLAL
jgi:hypothetical protein